MPQGSCARFGRRTGLALLSVGVVLALSGPALAQAGRGTVLGDVVDPHKVPVPGVTVVATETRTNVSRTAVTDEAGRYVFPDLEDGIYRVEAELSGFKTFSRDAVAVKAGSSVRVDMLLEVGGLSEEIVVTNVRAAVAAAQETKHRSDFVVDAIVAEDVGKLPDNSVAEALARVTGVQIRRDAGEANSVLIRGLPNVVTLLNGREVFTTTGRFIALGDVPANLLRGVDVYKSNGASQVEGGIAGTIDVNTRRAFDNAGAHFNVNVRAPYNDKAEKLNPNLGLTVSRTWGPKVGALAGVSFIGNRYHEERAFNIEFVDQSGAGGAFGEGNPPPTRPLLAPFVMGYIPIAGDRKRTAGNFALQWRPDDRGEWYAEGFVTRAQDEFELDFFVGLPLLGDGGAVATVNPGTNVLHTLRNRNVFTITSTQANDNTSLTQQYAVGGHRRLGHLQLSTDLSFTNSEFELVNPILDLGIVVPEVFVSTSAGGTAQLDYGGPNFDIATDEGFSLVNWFDNHRTDNGRALDWRGDAEWVDPASRHVDRLALGLRLSDRRADSIGGIPGGFGAPVSGTRLASEFSGLGCVSEPMAPGGPDYVMDRWFTPCRDFLLNNTSVIRQAFTGTTERKPFDPGTFFDMREKTYAAYGQASLKGPLGSAMAWSAVLGLRVVRTDEHLEGNLSQDTDNDGRLDYRPVTIDTDTTDFLPSLNTKVSFSERMVGRFTFSRTLTRPNFADLNPGVALSTIVSNTTGLTGTGGNPNLRPVKSNNFDVSAEWYFNDVGFLAATGFHRDFNGYVQPSVENVTFFGDVYRVTRPGNTGDGSLKGFELGYQQFYDFLPGLFRGIGLQANYTYMDGDTTNVATGVKVSITGLSRQSFNLVGLYVNGPVSARLAYNWRDKFLDVRNIAAGYDLHVDATRQLDGQVSYKVSDKVTVSLEGVNLLDTEFKDFFVDPNNAGLTGNFPRDTRRYDRAIILGVRSSF
jgi:iron complex outermembrane receptor protein